jgi:hypothetical protein
MKQLHHPKDIRTYHVGANRDIEDELVSVEEGNYIDADNMRPNAMDGDMRSLKKINGEEMLYPNLDNNCQNGDNQPLSGNYTCIGMIEISNRIVEFWADRDDVEPSIIRIDGLIVLSSTDFPITTSFPLQLEKNESCVGGEVFITDYNNEPMLFNIEDLLKNSGQLSGVCSQKYFTDFNLNEHILQLAQPADHPVFVELVNTAGAGLPVGYYQYSIRYATTDGDRTAWTVATPLIPVVRSNSTDSVEHPGWRTFTEAANPSGCTSWSIKIRFRVVNLGNFDFVEIRRQRYDSESAIGTNPVVEILDPAGSVVDVVDGEVSVREYTDGCNTPIKETVTEDDPTDVMAAIKRAKTLRYFNNKLYLMNVEYASRNLDGDFTQQERNNKKMYPTVQALGKQGHNDAYNLTNYKSLPTGERFGWGIVGFDSRGEQSFASPITGADPSSNSYSNYLMPNRRDVPSSESIDTSYEGMVKAARVDGTIDESFEVFDLADAVAKTDKCQFKNILEVGSKALSKINISGCTPVTDGSSSAIGYEPYHPIDEDDVNDSAHEFIVNTEVNDGSTDRDYRPQGFAPSYYALGMALDGVDDLPSHVQAFSVVRTKRADRIVAQGIGIYKMNTGVFNSPPFGNGTLVTKDTDKLWFYSPDLDANLTLDGDVVSQFKAAAAGDYTVQLVSPLGFFTEMYDGEQNTIANRDRGIDIISYARILRDKTGLNATININESSQMGTNDPDGYNYVGHGKWRNSDAPWANGNVSFNLDNVTEIIDGRGIYYELDLNNSIYTHPTIGGTGDHKFNDSGLKNWNEPWYMVNIIQEGRQIEDQNITDYQETGHYQKVDAIIGISDQSDAQTFQLVDERWEDCITDLVTSGGSQLNTAFSTLDRFILIRDSDGIERRWINVTYKSSGQITSILDDITANGFALITNGSDTFNVYGIYVHKNDSNENKFFDIKLGKQSVSDETGVAFATLDAYNAALFVPLTDQQVKVKYDKRIPIRVFGGDVSLGESIFSPLDRQSTNDGDSAVGAVGHFVFNAGFPYYKHQINDRVYIVKRTSGVDRIQDSNYLQMDLIRQLCVEFTCESKVNMQFKFGSSFPLIYYVMRPHRWNASTPATNIFADYFTDYPNENDSWIYGGFKYSPTINTDYSQESIFRNHKNFPQVGFEEQNLYCTRAIWSLARGVNVQNAPGIRTFPVNNFFDLSDDQGEIKYAFDALTGKGENLYAITENGVALLLTDKRILHEVSGNELATVGATGTEGVLKQLWITKKIGMNSEMWRSAAEDTNTLYFANANSVYRLQDNVVADIGRIKYHSKIYNSRLKNIASGYDDDVTAAYDTLHNEYWLQSGRDARDLLITSENFLFSDALGLNGGDIINLVPTVTASDNTITIWLAEAPDNVIVINGDSVQNIELIGSQGTLTLTPGQVAEIITTPPIFVIGYGDTTATAISSTFIAGSSLFVFNEITKHWIGEFDYRFDRYLSFDNKTYGTRDLSTLELNKGTQIDGAPINGSVVGLSAKDQPKDKEFARIRINSNNKPIKVEFYNNLSQVIAGTVQAELDTLTNGQALKDYYGYEQYIPRKLTAADSDRPRMQGRLLLYKIIHNIEEEFKIIDTEVTYKPLK